MDTDTEVPEECRKEMKSKKAAHSLVVAQSHGPRIGQLMSCENFSSSSPTPMSNCTCFEICTPPLSEGEKFE